jgi:phenylalanyl-tRNA synthetase beta chain
VVGDRGEVGQVVSAALDRPVWASSAFGVELVLGVMASDDVAPHGEHAPVTARTERPSPPSLRFRPLPTTPAAEFDLALLVPDTLRAADVEEAMKRASGELLERVALFDEFRGEGIPAGHRSLAWRLTFRHPERTLRDKEIEGRRARLLESLARDLGIKPRAS